MKAHFLTELETRTLDDKNFCLLSPLRYYSRILDGVLEVEAGFVSDGSSTPRVPIAYWFYGGRAHGEGVIHDRIYRAPGHKMTVTTLKGQVTNIKIPKSIADDIFLEAMKARKKSAFVRAPMYWGVKFGGLASWVSGPKRFKIIEV